MECTRCGRVMNDSPQEQALSDGSQKHALSKELVSALERTKPRRPGQMHLEPEALHLEPEVLLADQQLLPGTWRVGWRWRSSPVQDEGNAGADEAPPEGVAPQDSLPQPIARRLRRVFHPRVIPLWTNSTLSTKIEFVDALKAAPDHFTGYALSKIHRQVSVPEKSTRTMLICLRSILPLTTS
jgi:hypothetical protein